MTAATPAGAGQEGSLICPGEKGSAPSLFPWNDGFEQQFIVHVDGIDALVQETEEPGNRRTGGQRVTVAPHDILEDALPNPGRPVRCLAFVGATRGGPARLE